MSTRERRIQVIAYHLWEQEGRPDGHSERLWLAAEAQYEADLAKERYKAEIAKDLTEPAAKKPTRSEKAKPAGGTARNPRPPPETKSIDAATGKNRRAAKAKAAERVKEAPSGSTKSKPKAT